MSKTLRAFLARTPRITAAAGTELDMHNFMEAYLGYTDDVNHS